MRTILTATTFDRTNKDGHLGQYMGLIVDAYQGTPVLLHVVHEGAAYGHACTMTAYRPAEGVHPARVQIVEYGTERTVRCKDVIAVTALPDPAATHRDNMIAIDPAHAALDAYRRAAAGYRRAWNSAYDALEALAAAAAAEDVAGQEQAQANYRQACQQYPGVKAVLMDVKMDAMKGDPLDRLTRLRPRLAATTAWQ